MIIKWCLLTTEHLIEKGLLPSTALVGAVGEQKKVYGHKMASVMLTAVQELSVAVL